MAARPKTKAEEEAERMDAALPRAPSGALSTWKTFNAAGNTDAPGSGAPTPVSKAPDASLPTKTGDVHAGNVDPNTGGVQTPAGEQAAGAANDWAHMMPGFISSQVGGAQEQARLGLASDIQDTRARANSRGLLYSGLEAGGENMDRAKASVKLASDIHGINARAEGITATKNQLALQEGQVEEQNNLSLQQMYIDNAQSAYELAMADMKNQNDFFSSLMSGIGTVAGAGVGLIASGGNPVGAAAGANIGSHL